MPSNIDEVKKLDELISHLLRKNNQQNVCILDTIIKRIQKKNTDIRGPWSKLL